LNASLGEKAAALGVANIMKTKVKLGMGFKPKILNSTISIEGEEI
jgi:hypothetical protein